MCCTPDRYHVNNMTGMNAGCCHGHGMFGQKPMFWSKRKEIRLLQKHLDHLKEEVKDIEDYMAELQKET